MAAVRLICGDGCIREGVQRVSMGCGGLLFGPVALIAAVGLPVKESKSHRWDNDPDIQRARAQTRG